MSFTCNCCQDLDSGPLELSYKQRSYVTHCLDRISRGLYLLSLVTSKIKNVASNVRRCSLFFGKLSCHFLITHAFFVQHFLGDIYVDLQMSMETNLITSKIQCNACGNKASHSFFVNKYEQTDPVETKLLYTQTHS